MARQKYLKHDPGFVYVFVNQSMPGLVKIGKTMHHPEARATQLQSTGVATPFVVAYFIQTNQMSFVEKAVHKQLARYRVSKRREFFRIDAQTAANVVASYAPKAKPKGCSFSCFWIAILVMALAAGLMVLFALFVVLLSMSTKGQL